MRAVGSGSPKINAGMSDPDQTLPKRHSFTISHLLADSQSSQGLEAGKRALVRRRYFDYVPTLGITTEFPVHE